MIVTKITAGNLIAAGTLASKALPSFGRSMQKSFDERRVKKVWVQAIAQNNINRGLFADTRSKVADDMIEFVKDRSKLFAHAKFQQWQAKEAQLKVGEAITIWERTNKHEPPRDKSDHRVDQIRDLLSSTWQSLEQAIDAAKSAQAGIRSGISIGASSALSSLESAIYHLKDCNSNTTTLELSSDAYAILGGVVPYEDKLITEPQPQVIWLANLIALRAWYEIDVLRINKHWKAVMDNWMESEDKIVIENYHDWSNEVARRFVSIAQNNSNISDYLSTFLPNSESENQWFARLQNSRQTSAATRMADSVRILAWTVIIAVHIAVLLVGLDAFEIVDTSALWSNVIEGDKECFLELFRADDCSKDILDILL